MRRTREKIAFLCVGDEAYFASPPHAPIIALRSFARNFGDEVDYFCVSRFTEERTLRLIEHNGLRPLNVDLSSVFDHGEESGWGHFPAEGFYLGKIPELLLERSYDCCVVTDGDVYSNKRFDIKPLIEGVDLSAVRQQPDYQINTGVLLLNNRSCVEKGFFDEWVRLYRANSYWSEQPLLNEVVENLDLRFRELDITYNLTLRARRLLETSPNRDQILNADPETVKIAHFLRGKPWLDFRNSKKFDYPIRNHFARLYRRVTIEMP